MVRIARAAGMTDRTFSGIFLRWLEYGESGQEGGWPRCGAQEPRVLPPKCPDG
jgi:hypothetical protein